jgi:hypothetical protein
VLNAGPDCVPMSLGTWYWPWLQGHRVRWVEGNETQTVSNVCFRLHLWAQSTQEEVVAVIQSLQNSTQPTAQAF